MFRSEEEKRIEMNTMTLATLKNVVKSLCKCLILHCSHLICIFPDTGKTDINIDNVQDLLEASNYLQTKALNTRCVEFMVRNLDISNCVAVLRLADQLNLEKLLQESINFIGDHFQLLFEQNKDFKLLPVDLCEFVHQTPDCTGVDKLSLYSCEVY